MGRFRDEWNWSRYQTEMVGDEPLYCESYHRPDDVIYEGSDDEYYPEPVTRRVRYEEEGFKYLKGKMPMIMSASLQGPFGRESTWKNPWRSRELSGRKTSVKPTRRDASRQNELQATVDALSSAKSHQDYGSGQKRQIKLSLIPGSSYLPSPQSSTCSVEENLYIDKDVLERVQKWRETVYLSMTRIDNVWAPDQGADSTLGAKKRVPSVDWLRRADTKRRKMDNMSHFTPSSEAPMSTPIQANGSANEDNMDVIPITAEQGLPAEDIQDEAYYIELMSMLGIIQKERFARMERSESALVVETVLQDHGGKTEQVSDRGNCTTNGFVVSGNRLGDIEMLGLEQLQGDETTQSSGDLPASVVETPSRGKQPTSQSKRNKIKAKSASKLATNISHLSTNDFKASPKFESQQDESFFYQSKTRPQPEEELEKTIEFDASTFKGPTLVPSQTRAGDSSDSARSTSSPEELFKHIATEKEKHAAAADTEMEKSQLSQASDIPSQIQHQDLWDGNQEHVTEGMDLAAAVTTGEGFAEDKVTDEAKLGKQPIPQAEFQENLHVVTNDSDEQVEPEIPDNVETPHLDTHQQSPWAEEGINSIHPPTKLIHPPREPCESTDNTSEASGIDSTRHGELFPAPVSTGQQSPWAPEAVSLEHHLGTCSDEDAPHSRGVEISICPRPSINSATQLTSPVSPSIKTFGDGLGLSTGSHTTQKANGDVPSGMDPSSQRPSTPDTKHSSLPTPDFTLSLRSFANFMTPSPERQPLKLSSGLKSALSNPWAKSANKKSFRHVSFASLPSEQDQSSGHSSENENLAGSSSCNSSWINIGASDARSSSPPPLLTLTDLPEEVEKFSKHFETMAKRNRFQMRRISLKQRLLPNASQQVLKSPSVKAMAEAFIQADEDAITADESHQHGRQQLKGGDAQHAKEDQDEGKVRGADEEQLQRENEERHDVDDVSAVIQNLDQFLDSWDIDADLARARMETDCPTITGSGIGVCN